jgi:hypothetical protein
MSIPACGNRDILFKRHSAYSLPIGKKAIHFRCRKLCVEQLEVQHAFISANNGVPVPTPRVNHQADIHRSGHAW